MSTKRESELARQRREMDLAKARVTDRLTEERARNRTAVDLMEQTGLGKRPQVSVETGDPLEAFLDR